MCVVQGNVKAYCYECLFASTTVFGGLCCSRHCNKVIGWYQRACDDFKDKYDTDIENEENGND